MSSGNTPSGGKRAGKGKQPDVLKLGETAYIPDWFRNKMDLPAYAMQPRTGTIIGESEKAWKLDIETETADGEKDLYFTKWIPKSVAQTKKQYDTVIKEEQKRFEQGAKRYKEMLSFAKKNGVKGVREGMRKDTILSKIKQAGLEYPNK